MTSTESTVEELMRSDEAYINKITIKGIGCKPQAVTAMADGAVHTMCRIYGVLNKVQEKESMVNPGSMEVALLGEFEAVNLETGEVFRSGKLYLPGSLSDILRSNLDKYKDEEKTATVQFAFEIATVHASNPIGYSYQTRAISGARKVDALAAIRQQILALPAADVVKKTPALPAKGPAKGPAPEVNQVKK